MQLPTGTPNPDFQPIHRWSALDAAQVLGGRLVGAPPGLPFGILSTDSRALAPGDWFLAIRGDRFDGHAFLADAIARGAAGAVVDDSFDPEDLPGTPLILVPDTLHAYGDLAAELRRRWGGPVLAISGSAGKTTTRRLVAASLAPRMNVLEPERNFNNLIGVPQTLLRLDPSHQVAVLELGMNQPGELRRLTEIAQPTAALLTNIGTAHVGMFGSLEALAQAKLDLFRTCAPGVPLAINMSNGWTNNASAELAATHPLITFFPFCPAHRQADVRAADLVVQPGGAMQFSLILPGRKLERLELRLFGVHNIENVVAAAALLLAGGFDPSWIAAALPGFRTESLRGQFVEADGITFVLDCYNASPEGMAGALVTFGLLSGDRRHVLVLADMLELGELSAQIHQGLQAIIEHELPPETPLFALGPEMSRLAAPLAAGGRSAFAFSSRDDLIEALRANLRPGDLVLFKGSHSFGLEHVAQALAPDLPIVPHH